MKSERPGDIGDTNRQKYACPYQGYFDYFFSVDHNYLTASQIVQSTRQDVSRTEASHARPNRGP